MTRALVRLPSRTLADCELLHVERQALDFAIAREQHAQYVTALEEAGVEVTALAEEPDLPDASFVEDTVVVLDEVAILCRPGTGSRAAEVERIKHETARIRPVRRIVAPGTIDGGDVLKLGRLLYVGLSTRTNEEGIRQLKEALRPFGYAVKAVHVRGCLHLKTGVTSPDEGLLLANPEWIDLGEFEGMEVLHVPSYEPWGANTLPVDGAVVVAASSPRSADLLERRGLRVISVNISELQKAEAGVTCLSVLYSEAEGGSSEVQAG